MVIYMSTRRTATAAVIHWAHIDGFAVCATDEADPVLSDDLEDVTCDVCLDA